MDGYSIKRIDDDGAKTVIMARNPAGAIYSRFDLTLPINSKITRVNPNSISIDMSNFIINISTEYSGYNSVIDNNFYELYLGISRRRDFMKYRDYHFEVKIECTFRLKSLFSLKNWSNYVWLDDFINVLTEKVDIKAFQKEINWNAVYTTVKCISSSNKKAQEEV